MGRTRARWQKLEREALGGDLHAVEHLAPQRRDRNEDPHLHGLSAKDDGLHQLRAEFSSAGPPLAAPSARLHEETMELDVPSLFREPVEEQAQSVAFRY